MQQASASFRPEAELTMTVFRGCPACHAPHPLARKPPAPDGACPDCGTVSLAPETRTVPAELVGGQT